MSNQVTCLAETWLDVTVSVVCWLVLAEYLTTPPSPYFSTDFFSVTRLRAVPPFPSPSAETEHGNERGSVGPILHAAYASVLISALGFRARYYHWREKEGLLAVYSVTIPPYSSTDLFSRTGAWAVYGGSWLGCGDCQLQEWYFSSWAQGSNLHKLM